MQLKPKASVTAIATLNSPFVVGVPDNKPSRVNVRPGGSCPATTANVYGDVPPRAVSMMGPYVLPVVPSGRVRSSIVSRSQQIVTLASSSVTAACDRSRPETFARRFTVMFPIARTFPRKTLFSPNVADPAICQKTRLSFAPFVVRTIEPGSVVSELVRKIQGWSGSSPGSSVSGNGPDNIGDDRQ